MKTLIFSAFFTSLICLQASADCINIYGNISWQKIDNDEILIFKNGRPFAKVQLDYGTYIYSSTDISIINDFPCSHDRNVFLVDGDPTDVRRIEKF